MMRDSGIIALSVLAAQALAYALPPRLAARRWLAPGPWPLTLLASLLLGLVSQCVLGFAWSRWVRLPAAVEGLAYLGFWLAVSALAAWWPRRRGAARPFEKLQPSEHAMLAAALLVAAVVRSLSPLRGAALGQSDAYTHLAMFREILAGGALANAAYPPGFAWIMGMPAALAGLDPYFVARFGGAFFGAALTLAVYVLLREGCDERRAAPAGALLIAAFPGLMLLLKTGVGAFANQVGLFLLPAIFAGALLALRAEQRRAGLGLLFLALSGMLLTVPMMLLHVSMVLLLFLALRAWQKRAARRFGIWRLALLLLPLCALAAVYVFRLSSRALAMTAIVLTSADETLAAAQVSPESLDGATALRMLAGDFFRVKRWGLHQPLFDLVLALLLVAFCALAVRGFRRGKPAWVLLGCWGGLAAVQTATGFLQFTAYQREGWSLLIALGCLGALVVAWLWSWKKPLRPLIVAGMATAAGWTLLHPPAHTLTNSTAEESLVRFARMIRSYPLLPPDADPAVERLRQLLLANRTPDPQLSVITRPLMQEHMLSAVTGPHVGLSFSTRDIWRNYDLWLDRAHQAIVLLDKPADLEAAGLGAFASVSPEGAGSFVQQQARSYDFNRQLESYVRALPTNEWRVVECDAHDHLRAFYVCRHGRRYAPR